MKFLALATLALAPLFQTAGASGEPEEAAAAVPVGQRVSSVVSPLTTDMWNLTLSGGVSHSIIVDGDGDTDLDAFLYDELGNLVDADVDLTDFCVLRITPRWTGRFQLRIQNHGRVANVYEVRLD